MPGRLHNRVALVTGAARGIGRAIAALYAQEGARVLVNYSRNAAKAQSLVEEIQRAGGTAAACQANVANASEVARMVKFAAAEFGPVEILVNNAGILTMGSVAAFDEGAFDELIGVNVKGIVHCTRAVTPSMMERRYGRIVNMSSIAGLGTAVPDTTPYATSKAAVVALTKRMALEFGPHGINVNAICPGFIKTEMLEAVTPNLEARLDALAKKAILGRVGTPEDIAAVALFFASEESSFVTGQILTADGGRTDFLSHSA